MSAPQNAAEFLKPTVENVLTWGARKNLSFTPAAADLIFLNPLNEQLIYIERRRPTTYNVLTLLNFGTGWTGEAAVTLAIAYIVGIGSAKATLVRLLPIAVPTNNTQPIQDVFRLPAAVLSCTASLVGTAGAVNVAPHGTDLAMFAAPEYA